MNFSLYIETLLQMPVFEKNIFHKWKYCAFIIYVNDSSKHVQRKSRMLRLLNLIYNTFLKTLKSTCLTVCDLKVKL